MFQLKRAARRGAKTPSGHRVYAIGDIHGRLDLLDRMLDTLDADLAARPTASYRLVFLGDYVDRGPHSASVVERLVETQQHYPCVCLKGNHEAMLCAFIAEPTSLSAWSHFGGLETLMSYGLQPSFAPDKNECVSLAQTLKAYLPDTHFRFLTSLPAMHEFGDYVFVHAGLRPNRSIETQAEEDLLWIRDEFLEFSGPHPKVVVHGHTPVAQPDFRSNRINIDTGAYATGVLTCLVLEEATARVLSVVG